VKLAQGVSAEQPVDNEEPDSGAGSCISHAPNLNPVLSVTGHWPIIQSVLQIPSIWMLLSPFCFVYEIFLFRISKRTKLTEVSGSCFSSVKRMVSQNRSGTLPETKYLEQIPSLEPNSSLKRQEIPCMLWNPKLVCSQVPSTDTHPEQDKPSAHPQTLFLETLFLITLPSTSKSSKWSFSFRFPD